MNHSVKLSVLAGIIVAVNAGIASADNAIPIIPFDVLKKKDDVEKSDKAEVSKKKESGHAAPAPHAKKRDEMQLVDASRKRTIEVEEGRNELITIALGHINRIEVPFENPKIVTTSTASIQVDGRVIYVSTRAKIPVTMFVTPPDAEHPSISLSLIPKRIPPRSVVLKFSDASKVPLLPASMDKAEKWEQQPYIDLIKKSFRALAKNRVPDGYSLSRVSEGMAVPDCRQPGLRFDFSNAEIVSGSRLRIYIGVAQNDSSHPVEFKERSCATWGVAGVAAWPRVFLKPGEKTEVYVAVKSQAWAHRATGKFRKPLVE